MRNLLVFVYQDVARLDVSVNDLVLLAKVAEAAQNLKICLILINLFIHGKKARASFQDS